MRAVHIENVRCFGEAVDAKLAPLTILVGENSTGKSTFLAATRIAWDIAYASFSGGSPDFTDEPFDMGAFEQIASFSSRRKGRAKAFSIGGTLSPNPRKGAADGVVASDVAVTATFVEAESQPEMSSWRIEAGKYNLTVTAADGSNRYHVTAETPSGTVKLSSDRSGEVFQVPTPGWAAVHVFHELRLKSIKLAQGLSSADTDALVQMLSTLHFPPQGRPYAFAPIRSKPDRTYNPRTYQMRPEGGHVPMVLANLASDEARWTSLSEKLAAFGNISNLFRGIEVKRKGSKGSDPFQIEVKISGPPRNLVDVGYGVSQALPMLVDTLLAEPRQMFLMQQPEVHLHPRAQAELGTLLGTLVKHEHKTFVVETHSDYFLERVRLDVRDGKGLKPEQVAILFFERENGHVRVHPLKLDEQGNVVGAPKSYRTFFLAEERRFLGVE